MRKPVNGFLGLAAAGIQQPSYPLATALDPDTHDRGSVLAALTIFWSSSHGRLSA